MLGLVETPTEEHFFSDVEARNSALISGETIVTVTGRFRTLRAVVLGGLLAGVLGTLAYLGLGEETAATATPKSADAGTAKEQASGGSDSVANHTLSPVLPVQVASPVSADAEAPAPAPAPDRPGTADERASIGAAPVVGFDGGDQAIDGLVEAARTAMVNEQFATAAGLFREALRQRPASPELQGGLGISLVRSDTAYREAIPYLREALKVDSGNAEAWLALGSALQNIGKDAEAKLPYTEYLKLKPDGRNADDVRSALQRIP